MILPPQNQQELWQRAQALAGRTLGEIALEQQWPLPADLKRDKGIVGQLLEVALGATAQSRPMPDFPHLGIELKSIPVSTQAKPIESTFLCTVELRELSHVTWENCAVRLKLAQVLWIPIETAKHIPLAMRRIGIPILWSPSALQEMILRSDWQELTDMICLGRLAEITAHLGTYLQIRPKAAHARALCKAIGAEGEPILTLPRGFYLRASFTGEILKAALSNK